MYLNSNVDAPTRRSVEARPLAIKLDDVIEMCHGRGFRLMIDLDLDEANSVFQP